MVLKVVYAVCNALFFLPVSVLLGGLVMLTIATSLIGKALEKRHTEGWQIVRKLRGLFQWIELISLATAWAVSIALLVLEKIFGDAFPGTFGPVDAMKIGVLVIPTIAALYSTFYLTRAIRQREGKLGSYTDRAEQIKVRKNIAVLHAQAKALVWLNGVLLAALIVVAVVAMD
jgi:hypothetical protein